VYTITVWGWTKHKCIYIARFVDEFFKVLFWLNVQDASTADEAVEKLQHCTQPLLFMLRGQMWIKLDNIAIALSSSACVADSFELLLTLALLGFFANILC